MTKKTPKRTPATPTSAKRDGGAQDHRSGPRTAPAFQIIRQFLVKTLAQQKVPTVDIAKKLGISRSFAIKQAVIALRARTPDEKRIQKVAREHEAAIRRAGLAFLMGGEDIVTELAGGERPKLGPLAERRKRKDRQGAAAPRTPRAKSKAGTPPTKAKPKGGAPKKKATPPKPKAKEGAPKAKPTPTSAKRNEGAAKERKRERDRARRAKLKAENLKAPVPAQPLKSDPAPTESPTTGGAEDILDGLGLGATPDPAQPV